jgi:hypothetical protein
MTGGQIANGIGSAIAMVTSGVFIATYSAVAPWHKSSLGRFMMVKAAAICLTGVITVTLTIKDFTSHSDWLRYIQASLWVMVSVAFVHHTSLVWRLQHRRKTGDKDRE